MFFKNKNTNKQNEKGTGNRDRNIANGMKSSFLARAVNQFVTGQNLKD